MECSTDELKNTNYPINTFLSCKKHFVENCLMITLQSNVKIISKPIKTEIADLSIKALCSNKKLLRFLSYAIEYQRIFYKYLCIQKSAITKKPNFLS